jgi:hypothetical protein
VAVSDWTDEVARAGLAWARARLHALGRPPTGPEEQVKVSPWSVVYAIPTAEGRAWFKASGGETGYEAALAEALGTWTPDRVLTPLAVDAGRGWQLLPHGGEPLRAREANRDQRVWERFVAEYAELQRRLTPHAGELLAIGVPDHRPAVMSGRFAALLDDPTVGLSAEKRTALGDLLTPYAEACARLDDTGPAATIQHDDLHSNNVLPDDGDRFFDWGDASVGHPFASLLVGLRTMAYTFELPLDDPAVRRFRDAYLEPWGLGPDGPAVAELARWTGMVGRALAWQRGLVAAGPEDRAAYEDPVAGWLEELLEPRVE